MEWYYCLQERKEGCCHCPGCGWERGLSLNCPMQPSHPLALLGPSLPTTPPGAQGLWASWDSEHDEGAHRTRQIGTSRVMGLGEVSLGTCWMLVTEQLALVLRMVRVGCSPSRPWSDGEHCLSLHMTPGRSCWLLAPDVASTALCWHHSGLVPPPETPWPLSLCLCRARLAWGSLLSFRDKKTCWFSSCNLSNMSSMFWFLFPSLTYVNK